MGLPLFLSDPTPTEKLKLFFFAETSLIFISQGRGFDSHSIDFP
jgi:hypothetical protein